MNMDKEIVELFVDDIIPNRFQPREIFDEKALNELAASIKEHGVIQPIVVRTIGDKYEIIAGERRYKASVLAGKDTVPVIVKNLNDKDSAEIALIENIQRKNLTPIEEALSYKKILDMGYITQDELGSKLGKSQSSIANKIRLLNLSDEVQEALLENKISERHARSLLKLDKQDLQNKVLDRIISERLTVRRTDEEIEKIKESDNASDTSDDSQKLIERGEFIMNNNINEMPNTQPTGTSFDIFGTYPAPMPVPPVEPAPAVPPMPVPPVEPAPAVAPMPVPPVEPAPAVAPTPVPSVDIPAVEMSQPATIGGFSFDANGNVVSVAEPSPTQASPSEPTPAVAPMPVPPVEPTPAQEPVVPVTAPIIEEPINMPQADPVQNVDGVFSFGTPSEVETPSVDMPSVPPTEPTPEPVSVPELKMPEPIIITDYNKQYDPVMPNQPVPQSKADFREVINAIRECSGKIEQYGYKIEVEEYDLLNMYQVIFKIEK